MIYATIDIGLMSHPRAIEAGPAMAQWLYGMLWCRSHKEDGFLPRALVLRCPWGTAVDNEGAAGVLVKCGLWEEVSDGWHIHNYEGKNETRNLIEKRIDAKRNRQSKYRRKSDAKVTRHERVALVADADVVLKSLKQEGESEREAGPMVDTPVHDSNTRYAVAYAQGQELGGKVPFSFPPDPNQHAALHRVMLTHSGGRRGDDLLNWICQASKAYRLARSDKPSFESGYKPSRFEAWMNEGHWRLPVKAVRKVLPPSEPEELIPIPKDLLRGIGG